jgi:hypothetical protein
VQAQLDRALLAEADLPRPSPPPSRAARRSSPSPESAPLCQLLFDRPASVAAATPLAQSSRTLGGARQMVAVYPGDTARQAFARLRTAATRCQAGPPVRTEKVGDESYAARTRSGYVALMRVGSALTVLRLAGTLRDQDLMRLLTRQHFLLGAAGTSERRGKLEVCPRCVSRSPRWTRPSATSPATPR